jgi:hypothetical protein
MAGADAEAVRGGAVVAASAAGAVGWLAAADDATESV